MAVSPAARRRPALGSVFVDTGPLRRHRGFRRLWTGQLVSLTGSQLTVVAVAYQAYRLTGSTAIVGLVGLVQLFPLLAGSLAGGPLVDAWDRRRVLLACQVLLAAGSAGLALNAVSGHPRLWPLFACTAEAAAFQGMDWAARRASLRQLVPLADLPAALAVQSVAFQLTSVAGPAAAGLLIARAGFGLVYGLDVASFAVAFAAVALLPPLRPEGGGHPPGLASLAGGVRFLRHSPPLAGSFLIDLGAMVFGMPRALFPALAATVYGGGAATVGYLSAAPGLGAAAGSVLSGRVGRVRRPGRAVAICVALWGLAIAGFGMVSWLPAALALLALAGAADVISAVFRGAIAAQATPDALQGRVNSLVYVGLTGGPRLGDAEAGVAAALGGPRFAAWSGGLLSIATAVVTCWALPQFWRYQSRAIPAAPAGSASPAAPAAPDAQPALAEPAALAGPAPSGEPVQPRPAAEGPAQQ
jgi:MFS family permease